MFDNWTFYNTLVTLAVIGLVVWAAGLGYMLKVKSGSRLLQLGDLIVMGLSIAAPLWLTVSLLRTAPNSAGFLCGWIIMPPLFTLTVLTWRLTRKP